jgi:hypothetical protein
MSEIVLTPLQRIALAFYAFFAILFRADVAAAMARVRELHRAGALPPGTAPGAAATAPEPVSSPVKTPASHATVLHPVPAKEPPAPEASPSARGAAPAAAPPASGAPAKPAAVPAPPPALAPVPAPVPAPAPAVPPAAKPADPRADVKLADVKLADRRGAALQLLGALQREGRLVDFVEEDLAGFPDAAIGAAARTVHAGCKKVIHELFRLEPVYREAEGAAVTVAAGFDPAAIRLTGNVVGAPPFKGALRHHGWRAREVKLPPAPDGKDPAIVAPAEVEL